MADLLDSLATTILILEKNSDLVLFENSYIKQLDAKFTDITAKLKHDGIVSSGRGISEDSNLSLKKAVYEAIERASFAKTQLRTTNGVAIAETLEKAKENAVNELIEREIFLRHWTQKLPFVIVNNEETIDLKQKFYSEYPKNIDVHFYKSQIKFKSRHLYICKIAGLSFDSRFGLYLGYGFKSDSRVSIFHSFFEAINTFSFDYEKGMLLDNLSLSNFKRKTNFTFNDHGLLAKNCEYAMQVNKLYFSNVSEDNEQDLKISGGDFTFSDIGVILNLPLVCIRAENSSFLSFDVGHKNEEYLPHPID